jgi:hypothetical protein
MRSIRRSAARVARSAVFLALPFLAGCNTAYYGAMEQLGYEKRDLLIDRIEDARDAQVDAKEQFRSALDQFKDVVDVPESDLETKYDAVHSEFQRSETKARAVHDRIAAVENVGDALFEEWKEELAEYSNASMRRESERKLNETRERYEDVIASMRAAEKRIDPVLDAFRDQTLFLKHNLNARAIASLRTELASIENDTATLIRAMEASIAESEAFIKNTREL